MRMLVGHNAKNFLSLCVLFLSLSGFAAAAPLDPTFGNGGSVINQFIFPPHHFSSSVRDLAVQPDGKIVIVGTWGWYPPQHIVIIRYNADGSRDASFGNGNGEVSVGFPGQRIDASGIAIQTDGRIVVVGSLLGSNTHEFLVMRFAPIGSYDNTFGSGGVVRMNIGSDNYWRKDIAVQSDGKVVIAGHSVDGPAIVRLNTNGSLDTSFDSDGKVIVSGSASRIAVQQDGKIIAAGTTGSQSLLARLNPDGSPDLTFDGDGVVTTQLGSVNGGYYDDVALQPDGRIVGLGGASDILDDGKEYYFTTVVRYHPAGILDESFDGDGIAKFFVWGGFYSLAVRSNGQILAAGGSTFGGAGSSYFGRISPNGSLEAVTTYVFGNRSYFSSLAVQPDGKIVAGGASYAGQYSTNTDITIARFLPDVTVSGRVTNPGGQSIRNATVILTNANGFARTAVTSSFGNYTFENIIQGQTYTITARSKRYRFPPRTLQITGDLSNADLIGQE
jgi:uncharacterized delta-60 repeat protein